MLPSSNVFSLSSGWGSVSRSGEETIEEFFKKTLNLGLVPNFTYVFIYSNGICVQILFRCPFCKTFLLLYLDRHIMNFNLYCRIEYFTCSRLLGHHDNKSVTNLG